MTGVDYARGDVAERYAQGRALRDDVLARWGAAVIPHLPNRARLRVLDIGAGTGIFAAAWPLWRPCEVIALEPAAAMRSEMTRGGVSSAVRLVGGRAEHLPFADGSVDVAWLSTVIHHLVDLDGCVAELRRVLSGDGLVFVRGLFSDRGHPAGVHFLSGHDRALSTFPSVATISDAFSRHGLDLVGDVEVEDAGPRTAAEAAARIRRLRHADTLLARFTDDEIDDGLAVMDRCDPHQQLGPSTLALLTFAVPPRLYWRW